ncbi:MAG TPA: hypothetical protein VLE99_02875 [Candidatus Saccharimonadales bacterium]|nr:hypothetical protein [Candidatus Saccharimonadales bacterium]
MGNRYEFPGEDDGPPSDGPPLTPRERRSLNRIAANEERRALLVRGRTLHLAHPVHLARPVHITSAQRPLSGMRETLFGSARRTFITLALGCVALAGPVVGVAMSGQLTPGDVIPGVSGSVPPATPAESCGPGNPATGDITNGFCPLPSGPITPS